MLNFQINRYTEKPTTVPKLSIDMTDTANTNAIQIMLYLLKPKLTYCLFKIIPVTF